MARLWDKGGKTDDAVLRFTVGEDYVLDRRLVKHDLRASRAHALTLHKAGYLSSEETDEICRRLKALGRQFENHQWTISLEEEDCHTAIENRLGDLGAKVHLGRSRNDQVLVALRLYLVEAIKSARQSVDEVRDALLPLTQNSLGLPGYTHMQRAMPSTVALWSQAYRSELGHSAGLLDQADRLAKLCPLGSAAGYGTPGLDLDREYTARLLNMKPHDPVTAPQLSRGKAEAALAFALVTLLSDIGRLASDLCLYNSAEFGFVRLPDDMTTGSSVMPQKRNPDVFELVRGHSADALGDLTSILALTTKMPSGYHRDLQLIKPPLFRLIDRFELCMAIMAAAVGRIEFVPDRCQQALTPDLYAAERAFALVTEQGLSFRDAYRQIARQLRDPAT